MNKYQLTLLILLLTGSIYAQQNPDCQNPKKLSFDKSLYFETTDIPAGFGEKQDLKNPGNKTSAVWPDKENHPSWFSFDAKYEGDIGIEIVPLNPTDDYDFSMWKGENICSKIFDGTLLPLTTNRATPQSGMNGITGCKMQGTAIYVGPGAGNAFCKPIHVKPGDQFTLLVDNLTQHGKGFKLYIHYFTTVRLNGEVKSNKTNEGIQSRVIIKDAQTGHTEKTMITDKQGHYQADLPLFAEHEYKIYYLTDGYFFESKTVKVNMMKETQPLRFDVLLPKLEKGMAYRLNDLYFEAGKDVLLSRSLPALTILNMVMQENPKMKIRISGYANGCDWGREATRDLTQRRALQISVKLKTMGVDENRMTNFGFGCDNMVYPTPANAEEEEANRRVEIRIDEY